MNSEGVFRKKRPFFIFYLVVCYFFLESNSALIFFKFIKLTMTIGRKANGNIAVAVNPFLVKVYIAEINMMMMETMITVTAIVIIFTFFLNSSSLISESCFCAIRVNFGNE